MGFVNDLFIHTLIWARRWYFASRTGDAVCGGEKNLWPLLYRDREDAGTTKYLCALVNHRLSFKGSGLSEPQGQSFGWASETSVATQAKVTVGQGAHSFALPMAAVKDSDSGELRPRGGGTALPAEWASRGNTRTQSRFSILFRCELIHRIQQASG